MADYHAILKRAIGGLAEPTGESRRSVYEKARTALVAQLKSFDPPLSASEITQQRLQLEDAIRKVESESAKGLLSQALNRAALPERTAPVTISPEPQPATAPPASLRETEPTTQNRAQRSTAPTGLPFTSQPTTGPGGSQATPDREPTGQPRPPLQRPTQTPPTSPTTNTAAATGMRMARPQFEPISRPEAQLPTGQPQAYSPTQPTRPPIVPPIPVRERRGATNVVSTPVTSGNYEQEDVTQPVATRALKMAVNDIDRLGAATQETARRAKEALAEELSTGKLASKKSRRGLVRERSVAEVNARALNPPIVAQKRGSRWPVIIGLGVALAVVGLVATALYMKREVVASYLGTSKPIMDLVQRAPSEKPIVKSTDRLPADDAPAKQSPSSNVKVVTTQPISPGIDPGTTANAGGRTDVTPATPSAPAAVPNAPPAGQPNADIPPIAQKASLLEEAADGTSPPVQSAGKVIWQLLKTPSPVPGKPDVVHLQGRVEVPGRGIVLFITIEQNTDVGLQASHLIKLEFKLPPDFDNKSVARVPGLIMKLAENARGDPLAGATAKITSNLFWIALYAADSDKAKNLGLIKDRGWIDIPIVYETNKRAMLTLEKAGAGDHVFADALAAWGGS